MNEIKELRTIQQAGLGSLTFFETPIDLKIDIKRVYYITDVPEGTVRGHHAHKETDQFLIAVNGEIEIMLDNGTEKDVIRLKPQQGLTVNKGIWHTMKFLEKNVVLLVLASRIYDENDYIRDYDIFLNYVREGYWK